MKDCYSEDFYKKAYFLWQCLNLDSWQEPLMKIAYEVLGNPIIYTSYYHKMMDEYHLGQISNKYWNTLLETREVPQNWIGEDFQNDIKHITSKPAVILSNDNKFTTLIGSVFRNNVCYGFLCVLEENRKFEKEDYELVEIISDIIGIKCAETDACFLEESIFGPLLWDVMEGRVNNRFELDKRMHFLNWKRMLLYRVVYIPAPVNENLSNSQYIQKRISDLSKRIITAKYREDILVLVEANTKKNLEKLMEMICTKIKKFRLTVGVSDVFEDLLSLQKYYNQAKQAFELSQQQEGSVLINYYDSFRLTDYLKHIYEQLDYTEFQHPSIDKLKAYDKSNDSNLFDTLYSYLKEGKNASSTGKALYLHKNTVSQRIKKCKEILGNDLSDPDELFHILLSLKMEEYAQKETKFYLPSTN